MHDRLTGDFLGRVEPVRIRDPIACGSRAAVSSEQPRGGIFRFSMDTPARSDISMGRGS